MAGKPNPPWWAYKSWTPRRQVDTIRTFVLRKVGTPPEKIKAEGIRPETSREYARRTEVSDTGHGLARARKLRKRHLRGRSMAVGPTRKQMQAWEEMSKRGEAGPAPEGRPLPKPGGHGKPGRGIVGYRG